MGTQPPNKPSEDTCSASGVSSHTAGETVDKDVLTYLNTYLEPAPVQDPKDAETDPQLATMITVLLDRMAQAGDQGTILDVGCGAGPLLQRLLLHNGFVKQSNWLYLAVDDEDKTNRIVSIANENKYSKNVFYCGIKKFYESWPTSVRPHFVILRNVFHELDIEKTARLIRHVAKNFLPGDVFFIQDLMTFKEGERPHASWHPEALGRCLGSFGFQRITTTPQKSASGHQWFNIVADSLLDGGAKLTPDMSVMAVRTERVAQWNAWAKLNHDKEDTGRRSKLLMAIDLDSQLAALGRQLAKAGVMFGPQESSCCDIKDLSTNVPAIAANLDSDETNFATLEQDQISASIIKELFVSKAIISQATIRLASNSIYTPNGEPFIEELHDGVPQTISLLLHLKTTGQIKEYRTSPNSTVKRFLKMVLSKYQLDNPQSNLQYSLYCDEYALELDNTFSEQQVGDGAVLKIMIINSVQE